MEIVRKGFSKERLSKLQLHGDYQAALMIKNPPANAGDPDSIPGLGRSTGEGIGYPLQYSWASLLAHMVKNLPAMQKT